MEKSKIIFRDITSPWGEMIAGTSEAGVCFLEWHDRGGIERIKERVLKRYRLPLEAGNHEHLDQLDREIQLYFAGKLKNFRVPIAVKGTPFEMRDWEELLKIPYGMTISYGELARRMGNANASRAVGRANGANYLSIVIPCHRVIEANGKLRGYGGGLWRKQNLLNIESGGVPTSFEMTTSSGNRV
jgi:O-6-methylguanine DNA methyltransferase